VTRLDSYLVQKGFVESRNKASELIKAAAVEVDGEVITKLSYRVKNPEIKIHEKIYISRAGKKLDLFLDEIGYEVKGFECLDVGSSTGGFVQVLLDRGAKEVVAVDVGKDQLHHLLVQNPKVIPYQECDIRDFQSDKKFDLVSCDLSFISLLCVIEPIFHFAKQDIIFLFKPQFEVGKDVKRDKKGVVKDRRAIEKVVREFETQLMKRCKIVEKKESKLKGKEGNVEWFYLVRTY